MNRKSFYLSMVVMFFLLTVNGVKAQTGSDYFLGKWNMLVKGLPDGDTKMIILLEKKDSSMTGVVQDSVGTEISKFSKVEPGENETTVYFTAQGYDVYLKMIKKDEDHITGTMMGMFDAEGTRAKPVK